MSHIRPLVGTLLAGIILWTLEAQANHSLSPYGLSLHLSGMLVAFASLRLMHTDAWRTCLIFGLWCDCAVPVPFGLHAFIFLLAHVFINRIRSRIPREETVVAIGISILTTVAIMLATTAALAARLPTSISASGRIFYDTLASIAVIMLIAPWFFALTDRILELIGADLRRDQRGLF